MKNKYFDHPDGNIKNKKMINRKTDWNRISRSDLFQRKVGFKCVNCDAFVHSDPLLSGVNNRNHCPYCLWSKHLDLEKSGDRMAACKAPMQPVGISLKKTNKKYGQASGEILIIHLCRSCSSVSINRMAADDDAETLRAVFQDSFNLESGILKILEENGIDRLEASHSRHVSATLFGQTFLKECDLLELSSN